MKKKAIIQNFIGGFANFAFLFFTSILLLPYYFKFISTEDYGIWLGGISFLSLTSVLEANISLILTQQLGSKWVNKKINEFSKYYVAAIILGILIFIFIVLSTYFLKESITNWVSPDDDQSSLFSKSFFIYSISLGLGILTGFISTLTQVFLKTKWPPVFNLLSAIVGVTYTIWAVPLQGILALAWGLLIKNVIYFLFITVYSFFLLKNEKISFLFEKSYLNKIIKNIGLPFVSKVAMTIATNSQNFIIGITISATTTTIFEITKKIPFIIVMLINIVGVSTFTSFSLFYSEQKNNILHPYTKHYFTFIRILLLISLFITFILGKDFINLWVGLDKFGGNFLLAILCFTAFLDQMRLSLSQQYYTIGKYNFTSITDVFFALMFIILAIVLIPLFKLNGIVFAGILANLLYFIFCFVFEKYKNISLIINVLNSKVFIDIIGIVLLTIITEFAYKIFDNYYLKIIITLSSIIIVLLLAYKRHKAVIELILTNFLKFRKKDGSSI